MANKHLETATHNNITEKEIDLLNDFTLNSPVDSDPNKFLIFGNIQVSQNEEEAPNELSVFLGRWEGYDFGPPVKKDKKIVLFISEIDEKGGKGFIWYGRSLQYPCCTEKFDVNVEKNKVPVVTLNIYDNSYSFFYNSDDNCIESDQIKLTRDKTFCVYKDYPAYLESKNMYSKKYDDVTLNSYGQGYMLYLPHGYEEKPDNDWPLLIVFHGSGDRGENAYLLAKSTPFRYIREKGDLPCIIVAPLLDKFDRFRSFPGIYMEGVLEEIIKNYKVDKKRIYITGASMGGEATYRFSLLKPDTFAAAVVLCGALANDIEEIMPDFHRDSQEMENIPLDTLKSTSLWAIHGDSDTIFPLSLAQKTIGKLCEAGVEIKFTILKDHDHNVWTDTYMDPAFYEWLFLHSKS